jgi:hypothetical protein
MDIIRWRAIAGMIGFTALGVIVEKRYYKKDHTGKMSEDTFKSYVKQREEAGLPIH